MVKLDPSTINKFVEILRPFVESEKERQFFLIAALGNDAPALQHISCGGSVATFIPHMLSKLADFGGREALCAVLEYAREQVGIDIQQRIDNLRPLLEVRSRSDSEGLSPSFNAIDTTSIDVLVQKVRDRLHDKIQSLHRTMPLWGINRGVSLAHLFVDVNILEQVSSSRRTELDDLWQDFTTNNSNYQSLDRIGLGEKRERVPELSVLERNTNLMVVGKPGSGKTTYLQRIVTECNAGKLQAQRIPVLIQMRYFVDDGSKYGYSLEQFLGQLWGLNDTDIELVLNQGKALILLDGLDEVTGEAAKQIMKEIKRFARFYPQVQVVVTCRTQTLPDLFDWQSQRFTCVEMADFDEEQVRAFAVNWFGSVCVDIEEGKTKTREFLEQLFREENKPIQELAITPILLSLICVLFHQTRKFYSKRSKLYKEGLELLLLQWDKSRSIERDEIYRNLSVERKLELLSYVAVKKFEQQQYVLFEQEELESYIGEFLSIDLRSSRVVLRAIESQHGLLIERAGGVWSFSHLTFQEYLTAKWLVDHASWQKLFNNITCQSWKEIVLIIPELVKDANEFLLLIKQYTDKILPLDSKLQEFIEWVHYKSLAYENIGSYKPAAIRLFYIDIELGFDFYFFHGISLQPRNIYDLNKYNPSEPVLDQKGKLDIDLYLCRALNYANGLDS